MQKVTPFLWFDRSAEEAAEFYVGLFKNAKIVDVLRAGADGGPYTKGQAMTVSLELEGQAMTFLNGGPHQTLTPAFSYSVACQTQEEIDGYWEKILAAGGKPMACGWITDHFGLCWQIVPENIGELIKKPKAFQAMMGMIKLDKNVLEAAAAEE